MSGIFSQILHATTLKSAILQVSKQSRRSLPLIDVWPRIALAHKTVGDIYERLIRSRDNVASVRQLMGTWSKTPLLERRDGKSEALLDLTGRIERVRRRNAAIEETGLKIAGLLEVGPFKKCWGDLSLNECLGLII